MLTVSEAHARLERTCAQDESSQRLRYVSGKRADALERMGLDRVRDVLGHLPHRYSDFSHQVQIADAQIGHVVTVMGQVDRVTSKRPRPRLEIVEVTVLDNTGIIVAVFFRQPWIKDQLKVGQLVALSGKVEFAYGFKQMKSPFYEVLEGDKTAGIARILPVHPVSEGISVSWMRRIVSCALGDFGDVVDPIPQKLILDHKLMGLTQARFEVHFPHSLAQAEAARRRLAYDELLCLQLAMRTRQHLELTGIQATRHVVDGSHTQALEAAMPFSLTREQRDAVLEIQHDMASAHVMNRLLLGDVGTGKTAVAAFGLAAVADTGTQAAMMAPTSVLAHQYADKLGPLLDKAKVGWALVTGAVSHQERQLIAERLSRGEIDCIFGTTAILSDDLHFSHLSLVVVDEQHRFGVNQRLALREKGPGADLLTMSATPIPRTLALSLYGDIDSYYIKHRPRPGAGICTHVIPKENTDMALDALMRAVEAGQQGYVVCPLVDETDTGEELDELPDNARSDAPHPHAATSTYEQLKRGVFKGLSLGLLHGRMSAEEKDQTMALFRAHKIDILVSTTVIEVGVDVPEATTMLIYDADRFGLATLHQLRGRVGRGSIAGTCYLECAAKKESPARKRLSALERTSDGFELAELDLKLRHEGDLLGYRQHGGISLQVVDLTKDADLVLWAHADALKISEEDPSLTGAHNRCLSFEIRARYRAYFDEVERV